MEHEETNSTTFGRRTALKVLGLSVTGVAGLKASTDTAAAVHWGDIFTDYTALELGANTLTTTDIAPFEARDPRQLTYSTSTAITEKDGETERLFTEDGPYSAIFRVYILDKENKRRSDVEQNSTGAIEVTWTGGYSIFGADLTIYNVKTNSWEEVAHNWEDEGIVTLRGSVQGLGPYLDTRDGYVYTRAGI